MLLQLSAAYEKTCSKSLFRVLKLGVANFFGWGVCFFAYSPTFPNIIFVEGGKS